MIIEFEFGGNQPRVFNSVTLTTYCQLDLGIQPFSQMLAYFSIKSDDNGSTLDTNSSNIERKYHPQYLKSVNRRDLIDNAPQNITLDLDGRVGSAVKLELYFENKWLLISEIQFQSKAAAESDIMSTNYHNEMVDNFSDEDETPDHFKTDRNTLGSSTGGSKIVRKDKDGSMQNTLADTPERKQINLDKGHSVVLSKGKNSELYKTICVKVYNIYIYI